jgi:hypothetical protein
VLSSCGGRIHNLFDVESGTTTWPSLKLGDELRNQLE